MARLWELRFLNIPTKYKPLSPIKPLHYVLSTMCCRDNSASNNGGLVISLTYLN